MLSRFASAFSQILLFAIGLFPIFLLLLDNSLPIARKNYLGFSTLFLLIGLLRLPEKRRISEIGFYLWGGYLLVYLSYSALTHFPTNEFLNRNFFRFNHYVFLTGFIFCFRYSKTPVCILLPTYLLLIHSFFFYLSPEKGILMIPYILTGLYRNQKFNLISGRLSSPLVAFSLGYFLFSIYFTKPDSIESWLSYLVVVLGIFGFVGFSALDSEARQKFTKLLEILFLYQGSMILAFLVYGYWLNPTLLDPLVLEETGSKQDFPRVILRLPISSLGAISVLSIVFSLQRFLESSTRDFASNWISTGRFLSILNLLVYSILLYVSHSRTSYLSTLIGIFLLLAMYYPKLREVFFSSYVNLFLLLCMITWIIGTALVVGTNKDLNWNTLSMRFAIWEAHVRTVWEKSPVWGLGMLPEWRIFFLPELPVQPESYSMINSYILEFQAYPPGHSLYVQIFSSLGLTGILFYILLIGFAIHKVVTMKKWKLLPLFIAFSFHELTDYHLTEYPVFYPLLFLLSSLFSLPSLSTGRIWMYLGFTLGVFFSGMALLASFQSILVEIHKRDLSSVYDYSNLRYAIEKEPQPDPKALRWSYPQLDFVSEILSDRNYFLLKVFYYKFLSESDPTQREKFLYYQRKCFSLAEYDTRCKGTL